MLFPSANFARCLQAILWKPPLLCTAAVAQILVQPEFILTDEPNSGAFQEQSRNIILYQY